MKKMMLLFIIWFVCFCSSASAHNQGIDVEGIIRGTNAYCVNLQQTNGSYVAGANIILSAQCNTWKLNTNGTLESNNLCLSTSIYRQSSEILGDVCSEAIIWEFQNGTQFVNPKKGYVLTAISGVAGTTLSLERNVFSSSQTWSYGENPNWYEATISWYGVDMYMGTEVGQYSDDKVTLAKFNFPMPYPQQWYIYPDGTIRHVVDMKLCIACYGYPDTRILVLHCGLAPSNQVWVLTDSNALLNPQTNLVMEVRFDVMEITLSPLVPGSPLQKWNVSRVIW